MSQEKKLTRDRYDAVLFDLDGVLTDTASLHARAWKEMFDAFLRGYCAETRNAGSEVDCSEFAIDQDYTRYVDGKPRYDGVRSFLEARGIDLPEGDPGDPPDAETICGLGNRKNDLVNRLLEREGVDPFPGSVVLVRRLRAEGIKTAVVSSSRNCAAVLQAAGISDLFDTRVDGLVAAERGLAGKPAPDTFLATARDLGVALPRTVVIEDALSGVEAGSAGGFGLVIGVDRAGHADDLKAHGADLVVGDLGELVDAGEQPPSVAPPDEEAPDLPARLRRRKIDFLPEHLHPVDEWRILETAFSGNYLGRLETILSLSNGYLGMRGTHDEGAPVVERGTFINGFHETWPIRHAEEAYGFAEVGQTILDVPDASIFHLYIEDEPLFLPTADLQSYERVLQMRYGLLHRDLLWMTPSGKRVRVRSRRLASFEHRHLAAFEYEVTMLDAAAPVIVSSQIRLHREERDHGGDPRKAHGFTDPVLQPELSKVDDRRALLGFRATRSGMTIAAGIDHLIDTDCPHSYHSESDEHVGKTVFVAEAKRGVPIRIVKFATYHTSHRTPTKQLADRCGRTLDRAVKEGFAALLASQRAYLDDFWKRSDVQITGDPEAQQALRWNVFQLIQAAGGAEGAGIPAKGLTGSAYEGHYFWDTEIYVVPFLTYTTPRIARNLLRFRYSLLDHARRRAADVNQKGALFPWRTINGEEASAYYEAGTAQYHINADIAYALKKYVEISGDHELIEGPGAEILVETARLWADLGFFRSDASGTFHIYGVTGPDEYTTLVNDNLYTNLMARLNLRYAAEAVICLRRERPERYEVLCKKTGVTEDEIATWQHIAEAMFIPYDEARGIHPQDINFLDKEIWDFAGTPRENYPLLLHFHPLVIYRYQVIKQADIVLAMFLLSHEFSQDQKRRNFDHYDPLTTGDSSLSPCIQSIIAAELGYEDKAVEYFRNAAFMDLADVAGNSADGVHVASTGGVWMAAVYGFGGLRDDDGTLSFNPCLPSKWKRLRFALTIRSQRLEVDLGHGEATYTITEGEGLTIRHEGEAIDLRQRTRVTLPVTRRGDASDAAHSARK